MTCLKVRFQLHAISLSLEKFFWTGFCKSWAGFNLQFLSQVSKCQRIWTIYNEFGLASRELFKQGHPLWFCHVLSYFLFPKDHLFTSKVFKAIACLLAVEKELAKHPPVLLLYPYSLLACCVKSAQGASISKCTNLRSSGLQSASVDTMHGTPKCFYCMK